MKKIMYILLLIAFLLPGTVCAFAADEKEDEEGTVDEAQAIAIIQALIEFDQAVSGETPDVIELGQMLKDGSIDPVSGKTGRDNPFDEWRVPKPTLRDDENLFPLPPPPMYPPEGELVVEEPVNIVDGVELVGIMEMGAGKIAILKYDGLQRSIKIGEKFRAATTLLLTEIGDDYVRFSNEDGSVVGQVEFSFASL